MRHQIHLSFSCAMLRMLSDIVSQTVTSDINHNITEQMLTLFLLSIALWTIPCMAKSLSRDCESHQESNTLAKLKKKIISFQFTWYEHAFMCYGRERARTIFLHWILF